MNSSGLWVSTKFTFFLLQSSQGEACLRKKNEVRSQSFPKGGLKASLVTWGGCACHRLWAGKPKARIPLHPAAAQGQHQRGSLSGALLTEREGCRTQETKGITKKSKAGHFMPGHPLGDTCVTEAALPRWLGFTPRAGHPLHLQRWRACCPSSNGGAERMEVWHRGGGSRRAQPAGDPSKGKAVTAPRVQRARPGMCSLTSLSPTRCAHLLGGQLGLGRSGDILALPPPDSGRTSLAHPVEPTGSTCSQARTPGLLLSPRRCSLRPRLTRAAPGAGEQAAGFSHRNGVSGRAEVPYLSPRDQAPAPAPAFSPLGASCRDRGPSSWAPTCCPGSRAEGRPRLSAAALRPRRLQPQCRSAAPFL